MDDSTSVTTDSTVTANSPSHDNHSASYPFKNEVSLSINLDNDAPPSTSNAPTPSPRHHTEISIPSHMEDVPLTRNTTDEPAVLRNGIDNPGFESDKPRPLSSFGHNGNGVNDSTLGRKVATNGNGKVNDKPLVGK